MSSVAFHCVADARYFLGAVALVNSLRLQGHDEPIHLLDCGLERHQAELLAGEVEVRAAPEGAPPQLLKAVAPLAVAAEVSVLIDADMIATRHLGELIEAGRSGRVVAFRDRQERFCAGWGPALGLGPTRRGPYLSSGLLALGGEAGRLTLELIAEGSAQVDYARTFWRADDRRYEFLYADQDVFNAVAATRLEAGRLRVLDERLAATPPYRRLRLGDEASLRCAYPDGAEPYVLHQFVRKPWLEPMYHGIYSRLFARLLLWPDVAVRVPEQLVPRRMRSGWRAWAERSAVNVRDLGRFYLGDRLPQAIGAPLEARRRARERAGSLRADSPPRT